MISPLAVLNLKLWQRRLERAKKWEMFWRMTVVTSFDEIILGTNTSEDGHVKVIAKVTVSLDKDKEKIQRVMTAFAQQFPNEITERLITWEYKLSETEYHRLSYDAKSALADILTIKPATPTVTVSD